MTLNSAVNGLGIIAIAANFVLVPGAPAQQVPIPTTDAEVPGPAAGTAMTKPYVRTVGRMAYMQGWPLVDAANRAIAFSKAPEPGLLGGVEEAGTIHNVLVRAGDEMSVRGNVYPVSIASRL